MNRTMRTGMRCLRFLLIFSLVGALSGCGGFKIVHIPIPIPTFGLGGEKHKEKTPERKGEEQPAAKGSVDTGEASWYGYQHQGKRTASGEPFNMNAMTAAHRTLPFDTKVRVTNLENGETAIVRINDRGPFNKGRVIDVSRAAARKLGFEQQGVTRVRIEVL